MQIVVAQLPLLNVAFGTVPLTSEQWGLCLVMASTAL